MAAPTPEELKQINDLLQQQEDITRRITQAEQTRQRHYGQIISQWEAQVEQAGNLMVAQQNVIQALESQEKTQEKYISNEEERLKNARAFNTMSVEEFKQGMLIVNMLKEANTLRGEARDKLIEELKQQQKINFEIVKYNKFLHDQTAIVKDIGGSLLSNLGIQGDINKSYTAGVLALGPALDLAMRHGIEWKKVASFGLGAVVNMTEKLLHLQDTMVTDVVKQTGATRELGESLAAASDNMIRLGLDASLAGPAFTSLYNNMTLFRNATLEGKEDLATFTAQLSQTGITAENSTKVMETLTNSLNMTGDQAEATMKEFVNLAEGLEMSVDKMMSDFQTFAGTLVQYGDQAKQVFVELQSQSRATNVAVSELISISAQFDTFQTAADAVGRLNGMLGGPYLNSIDMVYKTESERIDALRETIELSGQSWDSMSRFEMKAFAAAAGIKDLNEAAKLFGTSAEEFAKNRAEAEMLASVEAELADKAKAATYMFQNFKNAVMGLAIGFYPLVEVLRLFIEGIAFILTVGDGFVGWILLLTGAYMGLTSAVWAKFAADMAERAGMIMWGTIAVLSYVRYEMLTAAYWRNIAAKMILAAKIWVVVGAFTILLAILSPIIIAYGLWALVTWGVAAAAGGLSTALTALGLPLFIAMLTLVVAAMVGLVVYWDEVVDAFGAGIDWISDKFGGMIDFFKNMGSSLGAFMTGLLDIVLLPIRLMINGVIAGVNLLIKGLNLVPGVTVPTIPFVPTLTEMVGLQEGGVLKQGQAMVAEGGKPEVIQHTPAGTVVTPLPADATIPGADNSGLVAALQENTAAIKTMLEKLVSESPGDVILQLDDREFGRAVGAVNKKQNSLRFRYS